MSKKSTDAANLKLNEEDMKVLEDAMDILVREELSKKTPIISSKNYMRSSATEIQKYFGNKIDAQIAILEMSLSYGHPITSELNEKKGVVVPAKQLVLHLAKAGVKNLAKAGVKAGVKLALFGFRRILL